MAQSAPAAETAAHPAPTLVPARKGPPATVGQLLSREDETQSALRAVATKFLPPERALRLAINAVRRMPKLAECDPTSFMGALMTATGLGLEPNTVLQHAYLIPYKQKKARRDDRNQIMKDGDGRWIMDEYYECQFQVGYRGFVSLMYRSGYIHEISAEAIYEGDRFSHRKGTTTELVYEKSLERPENPRLLGAFCYTRLGANGRSDGQSYTVIPAEDIYKIRGRSETFRSLTRAYEEAKNEKDKSRALLRLQETPWVLWEDAMAAKTAIKQHAKQHDLGLHVAIASDVDGLSDAGRIDLRGMASPEFAESVLKRGDEVIEQDEIEEDESPDNTAQGGQSGGAAATHTQEGGKLAEGGGKPATAPAQQQQQAPADAAEAPRAAETAAPAASPAPREQQQQQPPQAQAAPARLPMEGDTLFQE